MRRTALLVLAGLLAAVPARAQTVDEVRALLEADDHPGAQLRMWGDACLPAVIQLVDEPGGGRHVIRLMRLLPDIGTRASWKLALEWAVEPPLPQRQPNPVFDTLLLHALRDDDASLGRALAREHAGFEAHLLAGLANPHFRAERLRGLADLGWTRHADRIRELLHAPDLETRKAASQALWTLTGARPAIPGFERRFPAEALHPQLLRRVQLDDPRPSHRPAVRFLAGTVGEPPLRGLSYTRYDLGRVLLDRSLAPRKVDLALPWSGTLVETADADGAGLFVSVRPYGSLVAIDGAGDQAWVWDANSSSIDDLVTRYEQGRPRGVVLNETGREGRGIVALGGAGELLWERASERWIGELRSHPAAGGLVAYEESQEIVVLRADGSPWAPERTGLLDRALTAVDTAFSTSTWPDDLAFVPEPGDRAALAVVGGRSLIQTPTLWLRELDGSTRWFASLHRDLLAVAVLEPEQGVALIGILAEDGRLDVLTPRGTLVWSQQVLSDERIDELGEIREHSGVPAVRGVDLHAGLIGQRAVFVVSAPLELIVLELTEPVEDR